MWLGHVADDLAEAFHVHREPTSTLQIWALLSRALVFPDLAPALAGLFLSVPFPLGVLTPAAGSDEVQVSGEWLSESALAPACFPIRPSPAAK